MTAYMGSTIEITRGNEGPVWDPYGWEKYTVKRIKKDGTSHTFSLRIGLGVDFTIDGERQPYERNDAVEAWENYVGFDWRRVGTYDRRIHGPWIKCPKCKGRLKDSKGYVGEDVHYCPNPKCSAGVVWSQDPDPYIR